MTGRFVRLPAPSGRAKRRHPAAFTLMELLVVMFVMALLLTMAVPALSTTHKSSRVQQAAETVLTACYIAKNQAQKSRQAVAVYFGDDPALYGPEVWQPPFSAILPKKGRIEVWTVRLSSQGNHAGLGTDQDAPYGAVNGASPFNYPLKLITPQPFSFPEGVRIIVGQFRLRTKVFFYGHYVKAPRFEMRRHHVVYNRKGGAFDDGNDYESSNKYCGYDVLIFDESSGEHILLRAADWSSNVRPYVLRDPLTNENVQVETVVDSAGREWPIKGALQRLPPALER